MDKKIGIIRFSGLGFGIFFVAGLLISVILLAGNVSAWSIDEAGWYEMTPQTSQTVHDGDGYGDYDGYLGTTSSSETCDATYTTKDSKYVAYFAGGSQWDANADRISINKGTDFPCTDTGVAVSAWFKLSSTSPSYQMIADQYQYSGGSRWGWSFYLSSNHIRFTAYHGDATYTDRSISSVTVTTGEWYAAVALYDPTGGEIQLYIYDDELDLLGGDTWEGEFDNIDDHSAHPLTLGYRADGNGGNNPFHGWITDTYVYNIS